MMTKRVSLGVLVVLISLMSLVGSGLGQEKLEVWFPPYEATYVEKYIVPEFEKEYPGIDVTVVYIPWDTMSEQLAVAIAGGIVPDVMDTVPGMAAGAIRAGAVEDLRPYMEKQGLGDNDFLPGLIRAFTWNEEVYGLPTWADIDGVFWNKETFGKVGYDRAPKNWDELLEIGQKMREIDEYLLNIVYRGPWIFGYLDAYIRQNGGNYFSNDFTEILVNKRATVEAIQFYIDLGVRDKVALPPAESSEYGVDVFMSGDVAMCVSQPWTVGAIREKMGSEFEDKWDVALPLRHRKWSTTGTGNGMLLFKGIENPDAAWSFMEFFTRVGQDILFAEARNFPTYMPAVSNPAVQEEPKFVAFRYAVDLAVSGQLQFTSPPLIPEMVEVEEAIMVMTESIAFGGSPVQEAADICAETLRRVLANYVSK